jgi:hypothetical protein
LIVAAGEGATAAGVINRDLMGTLHDAAVLAAADPIG